MSFLNALMGSPKKPKKKIKKEKEIKQDEKPMEKVIVNKNEEINTKNESKDINENENENENNEWLKNHDEGQLSLDVFQDKNNIVVKSTIAGVKPENIDISVNNDMLTIRGTRKSEEEIDEENYYYKECYWGDFSRSIILPEEVIIEKITATLKDGVLKIILPKAKKTKKIAVQVKGE